MDAKWTDIGHALAGLAVVAAVTLLVALGTAGLRPSIEAQYAMDGLRSEVGMWPAGR